MKRAKKLPKKTRSETYIANLAFLGPEPSYSGEPFTQAEKMRALGWYSQMCTIGDAREYATAYLSEKKRDDLVEALARVADTSFPMTPSWLARIYLVGGHTGDQTHEFIVKRFEETVRKYAGKVVDPVDIEAATVE